VVFDEGPVLVEFTFCHPFRKTEKKATKERGWKFKATRPDFDNLCKPLCDAMSGIVFRDDGQIARAVVNKIHAPFASMQITVSKLIYDGEHE